MSFRPNDVSSLPLIVAFCAVLCTPASSAQTFEQGDVIVGGDMPTVIDFNFNTTVLWLDAQGNLKAVLYGPGIWTTFFYKVGFSRAGALYAALEDQIVRLSPTGTQLATTPANSFWNSFAFSRNGSVLVRSWLIPGVREFSPDLALVRTIAVPGEVGIDIDLAADQCTLHFNRGTSVGRFDICQGSALPPLVTNIPTPGSGSLRLLPDGMLIGSQNVYRVDGNGQVIQTYPVPGGGQRLVFALDPSGTAFWMGTGSTIRKIDLETGTVLIGPIDIGHGVTQISGIAVYGEPRAAFSGATEIPLLSIEMLVILAAAIALTAFLRLRV